MYKTIVIDTRSSVWTDKQSDEELIVDAEDLSKEMENQINKLEKKDFKLTNITPITSGNISGGNGYYHTTSLILTFYKPE